MRSSIAFFLLYAMCAKLIKTKKQYKNTHVNVAEFKPDKGVGTKSPAERYKMLTKKGTQRESIRSDAHQYLLHHDS